MSGRVLVRSSASETPLKRSTFLFTLNVSVIFSCFSFDFVDLPDFLASAGFGGSTGVFGSVVLGFLFLPFGGVCPRSLFPFPAAARARSYSGPATQRLCSTAAHEWRYGNNQTLGLDCWQNSDSDWGTGSSPKLPVIVFLPRSKHLFIL